MLGSLYDMVYAEVSISMELSFKVRNIVKFRVRAMATVDIRVWYNIR